MMTLGEAQIGTGSQGADVKRLQQILSGGGYNVGSIDGIFGAQTLAAVKAFQLSKGLLADGVVGPQTWAALMAPPVQAPPVEVPPIRPSFAFDAKTVMVGGVVLVGMLLLMRKR